MTVRARLEGRRGEFELFVDLEVPGTGVTAVFGPSGSGKTTLLRAVAGLLRLGGRVEVGDRVWQDDEQGVFVAVEYRGVGFVPQNGALFPHRSVAGHIEYARRRRGDRVPPLSDSDLVAALGLDGLLERRPADLSAGQCQRVSLARALASAPRLLLLDEPLANLDRPARDELSNVLDRVGRQTKVPVLYVTHAWEEVDRLAELVVRMNEGRIVATGPPRDVASEIDAAGDWDAEVGVVVEIEVVGHDTDARLTELAFPGGTLRVPRRDLGVGEGRRVRVLARDVSITLSRSEETSILNILPARVVEVRAGGSAQPLIVLEVGGVTLLSRVTHHSVAALGLAPGLDVWVQIKGVALVP